MWQRETIQGQKSQAVKDAEARITAEEKAMTVEERESRYQRLAARTDQSSIYRRAV